MWCITSAKGGYVYGHDGFVCPSVGLYTKQWMDLHDTLIRGVSRAKEQSIKFGNDPFYDPDPIHNHCGGGL